jgi:hypothetical protein
MLGSSWAAAQLAASQEGLSSMSEWVQETSNSPSKDQWVALWAPYRRWICPLNPVTLSLCVLRACFLLATNMAQYLPLRLETLLSSTSLKHDILWWHSLSFLIYGKRNFWWYSSNFMKQGILRWQSSAFRLYGISNYVMAFIRLPVRLNDDFFYDSHQISGHVNRVNVWLYSSGLMVYNVGRDFSYQ